MSTESLLPRISTEVSHEEISPEERLYFASQWQLVWRRFRRHKLAVASVYLLGLLYFVAMTFEFWIPYRPATQQPDYLDAPPSRIYLRREDGSLTRPFVYVLEQVVDFETFQRIYTPDKTQPRVIRFWRKGEPYKFWGLVRAERRFLVVEEDGVLLLFGTDNLGRDQFSRTLAAARISLSIGLVGVVIGFVLGCLLGGLSGFMGGWTDIVIQRVIEFLISIPRVPLWMALSAAVPARWSPVRVYLAITIILSVIGWAGLARVVRGKLLELREADYVMAASTAGATEMRIILDHMLPGFMSYLIVHLTLAIPGMIIGETALSFLGLGIQPPAVSWGTLLQEAQNVRALVSHPWMMIPGLFVIVTVLLFNFVGDGLRDAADPYM